MKNPEKEEHFLLTSPEEELRQLSINESVEKTSYQSPKMKKVSPQKFTIESWDISQKLKPFQSQYERYKDTISTTLTSHLNISRNRAKSAILTKDHLQSHNIHNFNNSKINKILTDTKRKLLFSNEKVKKTVQSQIQSVQRVKSRNHQSLIKSKRTSERKEEQQKQQYMKTIQSYLQHKKQQIIREKQILFSQRTGKQQSHPFMYPIEYLSPIIVQKTKKLTYSKKLSANRHLYKTIDSSSQSYREEPLLLRINSKSFHSIQQTKPSSNSSPIKRFHNFLKGLQHAHS